MMSLGNRSVSRRKQPNAQTRFRRTLLLLWAMIITLLTKVRSVGSTQVHFGDLKVLTRANTEYFRLAAKPVLTAHCL